MKGLGHAPALLLVALALGGCDYERLPKSFPLESGPDRVGLTVMYSEAMRDPVNAKFPPVTVRLLGVTDDSMREGKFDLASAVSEAERAGGPPVVDVTLNQQTRLVFIPPGNALFDNPQVLAAASIPWAPGEPPAQNYVERVGVFDEKGHEISPYVAEAPPVQPPHTDRRAVLLSSQSVRSKGLVLEVDREGVRALPSGLRVREARAVPPPPESSK